MKLQIGLQLYSIRGELANDFKGTLQKIKNMGYEVVEFAGLHGKSAAEIKTICEEVGLTPISAHVPYVEMVKNPDILKEYAEIGCKFVVIPYLNPEDRPGQPGFDKLMENAKMLGEKANSLGMKLAYHNHDFEFVDIDGEYALDILYKEVSAEYLQTELDTCWVNVGGANPSEYIRKYAGRCEIVHLKDFVGSKSENMYALIGIDENEEKDTKGQFELRPVGSGLQNFPEILKACEKSGTKWIIVEQDWPTMGLSALESAEKSIEYLKSL